MLQKIALKVCNGIMLPEPTGEKNVGYSATFTSNMISLGFMPDEKLFEALSKLTQQQIIDLNEVVMPELKAIIGAHVTHKPLYENFPEQVMDATEEELLHTDMLHYLSSGIWRPETNTTGRSTTIEQIQFRPLTVVTKEILEDGIRNMITSKDSLNEFSRQAIAWYLKYNSHTFTFPDEIPFKETMCLIASIALNQGDDISRFVKTTTDILRIATYLSDGDISLAENTKFVSFNRKTRKTLVRLLEKVIRQEDLLRHKDKWKHLLHSLHVGDYSSKLHQIAKVVRENIHVDTFNSKLEKAIQAKNSKGALRLLTTRPGIFARSIGNLLTFAPVSEHENIINEFEKVVGEIPTRNLTQLWGSMKTRITDVDKRVIFPKGNISKAYIIRNELPKLPSTTVDRIISVIKTSLKEQFSEKEPLNNVYIDPDLYKCPLPTGMRSASEGLVQVARGTRLPIGNGDTLRMFIYWVGQDIDLSATFHDEEFNLIERISYTNLREKKYNSYHSGDIRNAPNGGSEFIDVDIKSILNAADNNNIRYVAMNVIIFAGPPTFADHSECFAGWMTRKHPNSNEIFMPKTVEQRVDIRSKSRNVMPMIIDLYERKVIWTDITLQGTYRQIPNNVENTRASIQNIVEAFVSMDNKVSLGELFELHAEARGVIIDDMNEANTCFSIYNDEGTSPHDVELINSEYL